MIDKELREQLAILCSTRAEKLRAIAYLLRELLKDHPPDVDWALTDADGKTYAYVTLASEWQRRHLPPARIDELARRSRSLTAPEARKVI